ncbi:zinc-dependent alcohol dehydrogenase [Ensifer soli]|uniref:zinc-dependent alcohol dehydrogenase n=1 Tax=Ciceribacter sp. sgz301302 TaxID=3342379 RepID=UPI0035B751D6
MSDGSRARALWILRPGECAIEEEPLRSAGPSEVLVEALYGGISRGTERIVFSGTVPASEAERMRGPHMAGDFSFPVKYGYCSVGRVLAGPEALEGREVFCLYPHQDRYVVAAEAVRPLPPGLPPGRAVLAATMETALNIVWDAGILPGDRVAVFGAGIVGLLVASVARGIPGTEVVLVDPETGRRGPAARLGLDPIAPESIADDFDVLVNASASDAALALALDHAGMEARIVEASWYGTRAARLPLGGAFHAKRLSIVSSQVGQPPPCRRARWSHARRMDKALALLTDARYDALISGETAFDELAPAYPRLLADPATLFHRIRY